ncbi:PREDICTED: translationally-controlled tumor protein homolog [Rhagoletis zephyria]|uniref:translationally-controlled tumor protein homolog n=1 Tax=Rhagoletis zephyria TaxID=28612 RepID=UPI0008113D38|nr:PREDICTED: translationally-controlled tumor protein homolog [Rhagoletis zephyria]KAH9406278.1 tRNA 2'-phosphotransferase [Tyrophagus putrescentiae]
MIIFKDLITGDEMFTDSSKVKLVDDCIWEVTCNYVMRKHGDVAIDGFNPSAEGEDLDEGTEEVSESGYDIVLNQRLQETSYSKADFKLYLKNYTKNLMEKWKELEWSEEKINDAKAKLTNAAKKVLPIVGDAKFFMGESTNPDGIMGILEFRDGDDGNEIAIMNFFKHGLEEEKV